MEHANRSQNTVGWRSRRWRLDVYVSWSVSGSCVQRRRLLAHPWNLQLPDASPRCCSPGGLALGAPCDYPRTRGSWLLARGPLDWLVESVQKAMEAASVGGLFISN